MKRRLRIPDSEIRKKVRHYFGSRVRVLKIEHLPKGIKVFCLCLEHHKKFDIAYHEIKLRRTHCCIIDGRRGRPGKLNRRILSSRITQVWDGRFVIENYKRDTVRCTKHNLLLDISIEQVFASDFGGVPSVNWKREEQLTNKD